MRHHCPCKARCLLNVIGGSCGHSFKNQLFRCPACQITYQHGVNLFFGVQILFFLRHLHHITQGAHSPGYNGYLLYRLRILLQRAHQRMPYLMIGHNAALLLAHNAVLLFFTNQNHLNCLKEILLCNCLSLIFYRKYSGLIDHICQIRTHGSAGGKSDLVQIHRLIHVDILGMNLENIHTPLQIRAVHNNPAVKTSGPQKSRVQYLRTVGCAKHQAGRMAVKTIHLGQKLIQGLLPLVITAAVTGITALADGVNLIDKYNTGRMFLSLGKQIPNTGSSHTYEHFHKIGT